MAVDAQEPATMRVHEAAHILGIGRNLAYELARRGELPGALYLGRRIVVSRKMLDQYLNGAGPQNLEGDI
jgi:excisionase family DNA binding protein